MIDISENYLNFFDLYCFYELIQRFYSLTDLLNSIFLYNT